MIDDKQDFEGVPVQLALFDKTDYESPRPIARPEYNIGKFAGIIFASPYSKDLTEVRTHSWKVEREGEKVEASLRITPLSGEKTPTTTTLRVLLGLLQVWELQGHRPDGRVAFSARGLAKTLGWQWAGKKTADRISEQLRILSGTELTWHMGFLQPDGSHERRISNMSIVSSTEYFERREMLKKERFTAIQAVTLEPTLVRNMLSGHVRPLNYSAFQEIENDTAANLYARLDLYLSGKSRKKEISAWKIIRNELNIESSRYDKRNIRKAFLQKLVEQLDGKELVSGKLSLTIEMMADGSDWKLVARKIPRHETRSMTYVKPLYADDTIPDQVARDVIEQIQRLPKAGQPSFTVIRYFARFIPEKTIQDALSVVRADYNPATTRSLTRLFVDRMKKLAKERGQRFPEKKAS